MRAVPLVWGGDARVADVEAARQAAERERGEALDDDVVVELDPDYDEIDATPEEIRQALAKVMPGLVCDVVAREVKVAMYRLTGKLDYDDGQERRR